MNVTNAGKRKREPMSEENPISEEALKAKHAEEFAKRPEDFVDIKTLVIATQRGEDGLIKTLVNPATRVDLMLSIAEISRAVDKVITYNEMEAFKKAQGNIVMPKPGMMNRVRGAFGGKK